MGLISVYLLSGVGGWKHGCCMLAVLFATPSYIGWIACFDQPGGLALASKIGFGRHKFTEP
jgi:hypothetical protein